jgi:hypothetical protein
MSTTSLVSAPSLTLASGVTVPDSKMAREVTELVRARRFTRTSLVRAAAKSDAHLPLITDESIQHAS